MPRQITKAEFDALAASNTVEHEIQPGGYLYANILDAQGAEIAFATYCRHHDPAFTLWGGGKCVDFDLEHEWGGSYAYPLTPKATQYVPHSPWSGLDAHGRPCLLCDHKEGLDMALSLLEAGFSFTNSHLLDGKAVL